MIKHTITYLIILLVITCNAQVAITIPAQYEKNNKLILVWPYSPPIDSVIGEITNIAAQSADVEIIYNPDSTQYDTNQIRSFLVDLGILNGNIRFIPAHTNTYWLRQFSPITGYGVFIDSLVQYLGNPGFSSYNRPDDDSLPSQLANYWNMDIANYGLEFENTNIQYDGLRNLFVGDRILQQNIPLDENEIRFALNSYFNSDEIFFMPSLSQSGGGIWQNIDMYMKLLDYETILVSTIPDSLPDYQNLENIVSDLSTINTYFGGDYKIIRISAPPNDNGGYPVNQYDEIRSYTNSLILNNLVIVPSFGLPEFDSSAYHMYKKHMPGYSIYLVDAHLLTPNYGSIHTITKEIPQPNYLRIIHQKTTGPQTFSSDFTITCLASAGNEVEEMWLYYKLNSDTSYIRTPIHLVCPQHFAKIENLLTSDTVHYYIDAISSTTTTAYPLSAPAGNFSFWFDIVDIKEDSSSNTNFEIAPNPSTGDFRINSNGDYSEIQVSIYNSVGQLIMITKTIPGEIIHTDSKLDIGYYTIIIRQNDIISKMKLVITK